MAGTWKAMTENLQWIGLYFIIPLNQYPGFRNPYVQCAMLQSKVSFGVPNGKFFLTLNWLQDLLFIFFLIFDLLAYIVLSRITLVIDDGFLFFFITNDWNVNLSIGLLTLYLCNSPITWDTPHIYSLIQRRSRMTVCALLLFLFLPPDSHIWNIPYIVAF